MIMTNAPHSHDNGGLDRSQVAALIRSLTHLLNQRAGDRIRTDDHFNKYGVLLEGVLSKQEKYDNSLAGVGNLISDHQDEVGNSIIDYLEQMNFDITGRLDLLDDELQKLRGSIAHDSNMRNQD